MTEPEQWSGCLRRLLASCLVLSPFIITSHHGPLTSPPEPGAEAEGAGQAGLSSRSSRRSERCAVSQRQLLVRLWPRGQMTRTAEMAVSSPAAQEGCGQGTSQDQECSSVQAAHRGTVNSVSLSYGPYTVMSRFIVFTTTSYPLADVHPSRLRPPWNCPNQQAGHTLLWTIILHVSFDLLPSQNCIQTLSGQPQKFSSHVAETLLPVTFLHDQHVWLAQGLSSPGNVLTRVICHCVVLSWVSSGN